MPSLLKHDWAGLALVCAVATCIISLKSPAFFSVLNGQVLLEAISINILIALSQMVIIAIGQMNLSVGAIGGLAAISFAGMMEVWGIPAPLAAALAIMCGILAGALNGFFIIWTGVSAFVVTLATLAIFKGLNLAITEAQPFYEIPAAVGAFGNTTFFGPLPWVFIPALTIIVLVSFMLNKVPLGRKLLAVGANEHAAKLSGINVSRTVVVAHCISGFLAAAAGVALVARLQLGQPTIGDDWLLMSFAAPVIGGAVLAGGHVSTIATVFGVIIVALITQSLVLFKVDPYLVQVVLGALILAAVGFNRWKDIQTSKQDLVVENG